MLKTSACFVTKILYISYDGMTDMLGQSQVLSYISMLANKGYVFTLLSAEKKDKFKNDNVEIKKICRQYNITWLPIMYHKNPPVISTIFDMMKMYSKAWKLLRSEKFDIVHCRSYPPAIIGLALKRKYRCKFIFDMRGFWADERSEGKIWNLKNPVYKIIYSYFKKKEKELLLYADHIISLTHQAKKEINTWKIKGEEKLSISVIPCCVDVNLFSSENINSEKQIQFHEKIRIQPDEFILSYLGALGTWYMLDEMLDFFEILLSEKSNSRFLFITSEEKNYILNKAVDKKIPVGKITVVSAKRNEVPVWLSLANASIFFIKPVFSKKASSPTKQGEIMSMGIPIVCNAGVGDTDEIIHASHGGILIEKFDVKNYQYAVKKLLSLAGFNKHDAREYAGKNFSLEFGVDIYEQIYSSLLNPKAD